MMRILILPLLFSCLFSVQLAAEELAPSKMHMVTTLEVLDKLQTRHYEKLSLDDALSETLLNNYLETVDSNRQYFLEEDIIRFKNKYRTSLDDQIQKGDLHAAFDIFNLYRENALKQLSEIIENLDTIINNLDYTKEESLVVERKDMGWPASEAEVKELWRKRIKAAALALKLNEEPKEEISKKLYKRYKNQLDRLEKINSEDVYQLYMNAFTELYDPHTNYMSPANSENFDISMSLKLEGIGAMLRSEDEYTKVVRLIHAGPAYKQGDLKPSDRIVGVAQEGDSEITDVIGWRLDEVVNLIRGKKGTVVTLEVIPASAKSDDERSFIKITRDEVKLEEQAIQKAMIDIKDEFGVTRKYGVIDIPTFYIDFEALRSGNPNYKSTSRDARQALNDLIKAGAEGIIIDLRNNGGGSLREADELVWLFIDKGPTVQIRHSSTHVRTEAKQHFSPFYKGPLIVLINRMSASASEIFAGAIQDYGRGIVVGSDSFGKGTVQSLVPLAHGKLKFTEYKFYRISGGSTQNKGVIPDITLPEIYDKEVVGESVLDTAMPWDQIEPARFNLFSNVSAVINQLKGNSRKRIKNNPDFVYINQIAEYRDANKKDAISLNEKLRKKEDAADKNYRLELINTKRKAKGEKPFSSFEDWEEYAEKEQEKEDSEAVQAIDLEDPYLIESANILSDFIRNSQKAFATQ